MLRPNLAQVEKKRITLLMPHALYIMEAYSCILRQCRPRKITNNKYFSYIDTDIFSAYTVFSLGLPFYDKTNIQRNTEQTEIIIHFPVEIPPISRNGKRSEFDLPSHSMAKKTQG
jgi:hypothetical protein